ncbi:FusB/FusC family EF-G-binding protein [Bacillus piscicola]|uniref:FusB/FusC family EF-G-binding protein n=1 Tax=Bacillus piscicola TaxID=1632684 RepID=UPI001F08F832
MTRPFIRNHQLNVIKKEGRNIQHCFQDIQDSNVVQAVKGKSADRILQAFPPLTRKEKSIIQAVSDVKTSIEIEAFIGSVYSYIKSFPPVTRERLKELFSHERRLRIPEFSLSELERRSYLGWNDPGKQKKYIVYAFGDELVGVSGHYSKRAQRDYCCFCQELAPVSLVTFQTNDVSDSNPDYYRSIGQYICVDSEVCNQNITDVHALETFIRRVQ